jgi:glycerol-3-phosphate dehydrogenase
MGVLFESSKEAMNLLDTMSTTEDQQTALDLLFGESRRLCIKARETQTATELLLRRSRLLLEETKRLHEVLQSTIKRSDQLCKEALELQVGAEYLLEVAEQRQQ